MISYDEDLALLQYKGFEDFIIENLSTNSAKMPTFYSLENTFDNSAREWNWEPLVYTAGTHLIVACKLQIDGEDEDQDLYRTADGMFYADANNLISNKLKQINNELLSAGNVSKGWKAGSNLWIQEGSDKPRRAVQETGKHDFILVQAQISGGDGRVMIAPVNKNAKFYIAPEKAGEPEDQDKSLNYDELIAMFYDNVGSIGHFTKGYMYYAIPIAHNVNTYIKETSWFVLGDVGVVRNHWYDITLRSIAGLGCPVDDSSQPIIPALKADDVIPGNIETNISVRDWNYEKVIVDW